MGERFVAAAKELYDPGVIGPFRLQARVDKERRFFVFDVAPRVGGGTNMHICAGHANGNSPWRVPKPAGRRTARDVRRAAEEGKLHRVLT